MHWSHADELTDMLFFRPISPVTVTLNIVYCYDDHVKLKVFDRFFDKIGSGLFRNGSMNSLFGIEHLNFCLVTKAKLPTEQTTTCFLIGIFY